MEWISVKDRLPENNDVDTEFLVYIENSVSDSMEVSEWWDNGEEYYFLLNNSDIKKVTHWMQLPEPPNDN